jgi:ABC-type dipeptide/oligopeptide/nickel transport system permease subunit
VSIRAAERKVVVIEPLPEKHQSNWMRFWLSFRRSRLAMVGLAIVIVMSTAALLADVIAPFDPVEPHYSDRLFPPGGAYVLGTDELGRDIFSRLLYGARISLVIGLVAQGVSVSIGIVLGLLAGWYGGWVDDLISRLIEVVWAIPGLMFLIVVVTIF